MSNSSVAPVAHFALRLVCGRWTRFACPAMILCVLALGSAPSFAQYCGSYDQVVGWTGHFSQSSSGIFTLSNGVTTNAAQSASSDLEMDPTLTLSDQQLICSFPPPPGAVTQYAIDTQKGYFSNSKGSADLKYTATLCAPPVPLTYAVVTGAGPFVPTSGGSPPNSNALLTIDFSKLTFLFVSSPFVVAQETDTGCGGPSPPFSVTIGIYPDGASVPALSLPSVSTELSGSATFPDKNVLYPLPWTWSFVLKPIWDDESDNPCKKRKYSTLGCQNQSLGEDAPVVGTGFHLHYQSDRVSGRAGANPAVTAQARMLGGWTLNVHHLYDPTLGRLYLGAGDVRSGWQLAAPPLSGTNVLVTSADGSEVYVFDFTSGRHIQTLTPLLGALIYQFGYDAAGNLVTVTDGRGNATTIQRDASENATAIVSPFGQSTTLGHDANGYLNSIVDPAGLTASYSYDTNGLMLSRVDPKGFTYHYAFDTLGRVTSESDPFGGLTTVSRADSLVLSTSVGATPGHFTVTETDPMGQTTTYQANVLHKSGNGGGESGSATWPNGLVPSVSSTQQNGQIVESTTLPDGNSDNVTSGPDPRWGLQARIPVSATYARGTHVISTTASRTASVATPGNPFSLVSQSDTQTINGRQFTSAFTAATKTRVTTSTLGRAVTTVFDAQERVSSVQDGNLFPASMTYDTQGRLTAIKQGQRSGTFTYDANGFLASVTNGLNETVTYTRNADGRSLSTRLADGRTIGYSYDANGNLTSVTPPGGAAHTLTYTSVNQLATYTPPALAGTGPTGYSYDASRRLSRVSRPDGSSVSYSYDSSDRITSIATPSETRTYSYDATTGNLTAATNTSGESLAYHYNGPLLNTVTWSGPIAGSVRVIYDDNLWVTSQKVNGANQILFGFDTDGLLTSAGAMTLAYDVPNGLLTGTTLGGITDTRTYNGLGQLMSRTYSYGGALLYRESLTRQANGTGQIDTASETISGVTNIFSYGYDAAQRLASYTHNGVTTHFLYDSNSNRLSRGGPNATYDAQDRLVSDPVGSYTYTPNGELLTKTAGGQVTRYTYDAQGNLTAVALPDGRQISYLIDPENRRIGKRVNGTLTVGFLYQGSHIVAQVDASGNVVSRFVYASGANSPDYMIAGGATYRIISNHLGSPRLIVNVATGAISQQIDYGGPWGNVVGDTNPGFQPFGFAGGLYDPDTQLVRFEARDYAPSEGRWTAKDPFLFDGGDINLYAYAANDPVNKGDPTGTDDIPDVSSPQQSVGDKIAEGMSNGAKWVCAKGKMIADKAAELVREKVLRIPLGPGKLKLDGPAPAYEVGTSANVSVDGVNVAGVTATGEVAVNSSSDPTQLIDLNGKIGANVGPVGGTLVEGHYRITVVHEFMDGPNTNAARLKACTSGDECNY
jgi:RHS repeat-associated protein